MQQLARILPDLRTDFHRYGRWPISSIETGIPFHLKTFSIPDHSEDDLGRQLSNARLRGVPWPKGAKGRVAVELVERADLVRTVHRSGAGALRGEIRMVENVEVFNAELELYAFRGREVFGKLHVPIYGSWQPKDVLSNIAKGVDYGGMVCRLSARAKGGGLRGEPSWLGVSKAGRARVDRGPIGCADRDTMR